MRGRERDGSFQQHFERGTWIGVGDDFVTPHDGGTVRGQDVTRVVDGGGGVHDAGDAQRLELGDELCGAGVVDVDDARVQESPQARNLPSEVQSKRHAGPG